MVTIPNHFAKAALIPSVWLLSFLGSFLLLPISDALQSAAVISCLAALVGWSVIKAETHFKMNGLSVLMGALWLVALNSVVWSEVKIVSLTFFFFFSAFPLTFFLFSLEKSDDVWRPIRWMIAGLGAFSLIQFLAIPSMLKFGGTHWPLEDNNSLAAILGAGVILWIGEALRGGKWMRAQIVVALLCFAGVMTTGGWAVFLGLLLLIPVFICMTKPQSLKPLWLFAAGVILLLLTMTTTEMNIYRLFNGGSGAADILMNKGLAEKNSISGDRWAIWSATIAIFKTAPWAGTGIGTFFLYYPEFRVVTENSAGYQAHNDLLQFAAEMGWAAPVLAIFIVFYVIAKTITALRGITAIDARLNIIIPFAVFGLIIGHSLVNFNMYVLPTIMMAGLCLGTWMPHVRAREVALPVKRAIREGVVFGVIVVAFVPLWGSYLSEYYTSRATQDLAAENIQGFASNLNLADKWGMNKNGRAILQGAKFAAATKNEARALILLDEAETTNPRLIQIYIERANLLRATDDAKALEQAQKALALDKASLEARLTVSDILLQMKRDQESYDVLKGGLDVAVHTSDPTEFYSTLAQRAVNQMDLETSEKALKRLREPRIKR